MRTIFVFSSAHCPGEIPECGELMSFDDVDTLDSSLRALTKRLADSIDKSDDLKELLKSVCIYRIGFFEPKTLAITSLNPYLIGTLFDFYESDLIPLDNGGDDNEE